MKRFLESNQTKEHSEGKGDSLQLDKHILKVRQSGKMLKGEKLVHLWLIVESWGEMARKL